MTIEGVDYADARPSPAGLYAAGKRFVVRYGGPGRDSKQLHAAELRGLLAAGLSVVANAEGSANGYRGRAAGRSWAQQAEDHFRGLGMPADRPIYFSVDWAADSGDWADIDAALRGSAEIIGPARVGVYGGYATIAHAASAKTARWFWQTYAWSGGKWHPAAHMQQYRNGVTVAGGDCDLNRAMTADYGQWGQKEAAMAGLDLQDFKTLWTTDGVIAAPSNAASAETNPTWAPASFLTDASFYARANYALSQSILTLLQSVATKVSADPVNEQEIVAGILAGLPAAVLGDAVVAAIKALPAETAAATVAQIREAFAE